MLAVLHRSYSQAGADVQHHSHSQVGADDALSSVARRLDEEKFHEMSRSRKINSSLNEQAHTLSRGRRNSSGSEHSSVRAWMGLSQDECLLRQDECNDSASHGSMDAVYHSHSHAGADDALSSETGRLDDVESSCSHDGGCSVRELRPASPRER